MSDDQRTTSEGAAREAGTATTAAGTAAAAGGLRGSDRRCRCRRHLGVFGWHAARLAVGESKGVWRARASQ